MIDERKKNRFEAPIDEWMCDIPGITLSNDARTMTLAAKAASVSCAPGINILSVLFIYLLFSFIHSSTIKPISHFFGIVLCSLRFLIQCMYLYVHAQLDQWGWGFFVSCFKFHSSCLNLFSYEEKKKKNIDVNMLQISDRKIFFSSFFFLSEQKMVYKCLKWNCQDGNDLYDLGRAQTILIVKFEGI